MEETSSDRDKQRIKDRVKQASKQTPPANNSKAATVFVWDTFDKIHPRIVRRRVTRDAAETVFLAHNKDTRRYDPYFHEWDCWEGWAPRTQSDMDALLDEEAPDTGIVVDMSRVPGLPSPTTSRSSSPIPSTDPPAMSTSHDAPTLESESHMTMDVVQEGHVPDPEPDHLTGIMPTNAMQHTSGDAMDTDVAQPPTLSPAATADDDEVSICSRGNAEDSMPSRRVDDEENGVDDSHLEGDDIVGNLHVPVDESLLEHLEDAFIYRYGFCAKDVSVFCFSSEAREYSRDTLDKVTQVYVHRSEVVPRHLHMPIIDFANILVANHQIENGMQIGNVVSLGGLWDLSLKSPIPKSSD